MGNNTGWPSLSKEEELLQRAPLIEMEIQHDSSGIQLPGQALRLSITPKSSIISKKPGFEGITTDTLLMFWKAIGNNYRRSLLAHLLSKRQLVLRVESIKDSAVSKNGIHLSYCLRHAKSSLLERVKSTDSPNPEKQSCFWSQTWLIMTTY